MANSTQTVVSDGGLVLLDISFDYLDRSSISVYFDSVLTEDWAWVGVSDKQITFDPAVPVGTVVLVKRTTDLSALRHAFTLGAAFTAQSLDEDLKQVLFVAQEATEANFGGSFYGDIDMHSNRIVNIADAVNATDVPSLGQLQGYDLAAAASAAEAASILDSFDDRYLGVHESDPVLDNDGNPLLTGSLYWSTADTAMKVYTGITWVLAYVVGEDFALHTDVAAAIAAHAALADPHPTYTTADELSAYAQPVNANLTALAGLTGSSNRIAYFTGAGTMAIATLTAFGRTIIDDANAATARATLGAAADASVQTIWIPAGAIAPSITAGAAPSVAEMPTVLRLARSLDFDATTQEHGEFMICMPKGWNEGTVTAQFHWSHAASTVNFGVVWALQATAIGDTDMLTAAWGGGVTVADTGSITDRLYITTATAAITAAGSAMPQDLVSFRVYRVVADASDTLAIDARLHGITLFYTTTSLNDA